MSQLYDRCNRCTNLAFLSDKGLCPDCELKYGHLYTPKAGSKTCPYCNGTRKQIHIFGPDTKCDYCNGTGKVPY